MRVNVCVNGTFRYPDYIAHYERAGVLNGFFYAHHRAATPARLGLRSCAAHNLWAKQYLLRAAFHAAPPAMAPALSTAICDGWQRAVIRRWRDCDSLEAVIGAVADKVIGHARAVGTRVLGHPVTCHPTAVEQRVGRAYQSLGLDPRRAHVPDLDRRLEEIAQCDRLLVDSALVARSFMALGVAASKIAVVRPGLDLDRFQPRDPGSVNRATFDVVCVGIITPRKAQHILLEAWRRLKLPRARLILVGALGRDAGAVLHGQEGRFTHIAHIDQANLRALLVRCSAFVLCSAEDGFGQAPYEAMACGLPTIVSDGVGMAEAMRPGVDGLVVPALDVEALAAALDELFRDRDRAEQMGQAAAANVHAAGPWSDYVTRVIAEHRTLVATSPVTAREAA